MDEGGDEGEERVPCNMHRQRQGREAAGSRAAAVRGPAGFGDGLNSGAKRRNATGSRRHGRMRTTEFEGWVCTRGTYHQRTAPQRARPVK